MQVIVTVTIPPGRNDTGVDRRWSSRCRTARHRRGIRPRPGPPGPGLGGVLVRDAARAAAAAACSTSCLPCAYRPSPTTSNSSTITIGASTTSSVVIEPRSRSHPGGCRAEAVHGMVSPRRSRVERVAVSWMSKVANGMTVSTSACTITVTPAGVHGHGDRRGRAADSGPPRRGRRPRRPARTAGRPGRRRPTGRRFARRPARRAGRARPARTAPPAG